MRKRVIRFCCLIGLLFFISGCAIGKSEGEFQEKQEDITLTWYINFSWFPSSWGENLVSKAITEKTGVTIEFVVPGGDEDKKLNSLINSDSLPDLLTLNWWEDEIGEMINSDMVFALDELADEYEDKSEEEFEEAVKRRLEEFEPYWTKVIAIYATN